MAGISMSNGPFHMNLLCRILAFAGTLVMAAGCGGGSADAPAPRSTTLLATSAASVPDVQAYHDAVQRLYVAYFGRPADVGGLAFYAGHLQAMGLPTDPKAVFDAYHTHSGVRDLVDSFANSKESADLYPGDEGSFVDAVYRNLFNRTADAGGKAYWVDLLQRGLMTRSAAAVNIMGGAQNSDITAVNNKVAAASSFTGSLDSPQRQELYSGDVANALVRSILQKVDATTSASTIATTVNSMIGSLVGALPADGMYGGALDSGMPLLALLLENGEFWGLYGAGNRASFEPAGFLQGQGTLAYPKLTINNARDFQPLPAVPVVLDLHYEPRTALGGTISTNAGTFTFDAVPVSTAEYDYSTPADLSKLTGTWHMSDSDGLGNTVVVGTTGLLTGQAATFDGQCSYTGGLTQRPGGKNVLNASVTYGGGCALAYQTMTGIAVSMLLDEGATRMWALAVRDVGMTAGNLLQGRSATALGRAPTLSSSDLVVGTGAMAVSGKRLTVNYTGWLYNSSKANLRSTRIDSSYERGQPFSFQLGAGGVIAGWDAGLVGMRVGGKRTLVVPGSLAYGSQGVPGLIAPNASLVFEVELLAVQ
jgi:hypothetical protein